MSTFNFKVNYPFKWMLLFSKDTYKWQ